MSEIEELTEAERYLLDRRRKGENQTQAAARLGISRQKYNKLECGNLSLLPERQVPAITIASLSGGERCLLYRRRLGLTQTALAAERSMSRYWINRQERDAVDSTDLICYWEC